MMNWHHTFSKTNAYISDQELPWEMPEGLKVLPEVTFLEDKVVADTEPIAWAKWMTSVVRSEILPEHEVQETPGAEAEVPVPLEEQYPWLKDVDALPFNAEEKTLKASGSGEGKKSVDIGPDFAGLTEPEVLKIFQILEQKRAEWAQTIECRQEDFKCWMPGGPL